MERVTKIEPLRQSVKQRVLALLRKPEIFSKDEIDEAVDQTLYLTPLDIAFGLKYSEQLCRRCGECCRVSKEVILEPHEVVELATSLNISISNFLLRYVKFRKGETYLKREGGACCFLRKDNLCSVYEARPAVCRTFPFGRMDEGILYGVDIKCGLLVELFALKAAVYVIGLRMPL